MGIFTAVNQDCGTYHCEIDEGGPCTKGLFNGGWTDWVKTNEEWWPNVPA
jgi:hypothetical protein